MFQASIKGLVIAEASTRAEVVAQVACEGYSTARCIIKELACFGHEATRARRALRLGNAYDMLDRCGSTGLPLATLEQFCSDAYREAGELDELARAFEQAGATAAAAICRNRIGA